MDELLSQDEINALLSGESFSAPSSDLSVEDSHVLDEILGIFANAQSSVFEMLAGKEVKVSPKDVSVSSQTELKAKLPETPFVFRVTFGGLDDIPLIFAVERRGALTLADLMMGGEGKELPEEASELYLNAAQEGLSQVVGSSFTSLSGLLGGRRLMPENTSSALEAEDWLPFPKEVADSKLWTAMTEVQIEGLEPFFICIALPLESAKTIINAMHGAMGAQQPAASAPQASTSTASPSPAQGIPSGGAMAASASMPSSPTLGMQRPGPVVDVHPAEFTPLTPSAVASGGSKIDMIADIPVRVTVELGKTRKNISDILNMTTGSVIELDKMAGEPVDVLVNGKLIAKGEVVVIDENFGVRITEVLNTTSKAYSI